MISKIDEQQDDRARWNEKYQAKGPEIFGRAPAPWLVMHQDILLHQPRGPALDVACGNGRNARYLAGLGFEVEAVDISDVVIDWLQQRVEEWKLPIQPRCVDLTTASLPWKKYQVIANFLYLERRLFQALKDALLPGGLLFFETFTKDHLKRSGNYVNPIYALEPNELLRAFADLRIIHYQEMIVADEIHDRPNAVARLVARKVSRG
ncbi:MAG: class I SAM-dependent methyltransferase [candidate division KSB1 bacterium]|nr:class I SAM-dependent methyltransferase [candidate division KSB1 bacterium]